MILPRAVARRPLALLTVAVLAAHLLVLAHAAKRELKAAAGMRTLVTRVVPAATPAQPAAPPAEKPVVQQEAARPPPQPAPPVEAAPTARTVSPLAETVAAAPPEPPASAPAPVLETAPAAEPTEAAAPPAADAGVPAPAASYAIPGSVRLRYAVNGKSRGQSWNVNGELNWRQDGERYEATLDYSAPLLPSRSQSSSGRIRDDGLQPFRFSDKGRGSEQAAHFERDTRTLIFSNNAPQQPLLPGAQDRLSVFMQLAALLAADPAKFPAGTSITVQTVGTRDSQPWTFAVEGDESLDLPGGRVATRKLVRQPGAEYDTRVELWLGIAMDYVPVRIRLTQANGDYVDQQWTSTDRP